MFDSSYFHGKHFDGDYGLRNIFVYQPTFNTLNLIKYNDTDNVIGWKLNDLSESKLFTLHDIFVIDIKYFKVGTQFSNIYDLDNWPKIWLELLR